MLNRKVPIRIVKVKVVKDTRHFSLWQLLSFALVFALIGGYIIYRGFAASPTPVTAPVSVSAPTNLTEATLPRGIVNLSWTAPSGQSPAGYKIYEYSTTDAVSSDISTLASSSIYIGTTTQTSYRVTGLQTNSSYDFYVVAVDSSVNASNPTNHVLADTSSTQLTTASSLKALYASTSGTASSSFPYASPFGDQNCDPNNITSDKTDNCVTDCTGGKSVCGGSCVLVTNPSDPSGNKITGDCRPMTFQTCDFDDKDQQAGVPGHTLVPSRIDPGVDYNVTFPQTPDCSYNNPNPKDTGSDDSSNAPTNTRIYAMGDGKITCMAANPGYSLHPYCPGDSAVKLSPGGPGAWIWMVYKLTKKGGAAQGREIYVAEGCALAANAINNVTATGGTGNKSGDRLLGHRWAVGNNVTSNSVLCEIRNDSAIETGWANEDSQTLKRYNKTLHKWVKFTTKSEILPAAYTCYKEHDTKYGIWSTKWGHSFNYFILKSDFNRFSGKPGPYAYHDCADWRLKAKYKNSAWYPN